MVSSEVLFIHEDGSKGGASRRVINAHKSREGFRKQRKAKIDRLREGRQPFPSAAKPSQAIVTPPPSTTPDSELCRSDRDSDQACVPNDVLSILSESSIVLSSKVGLDGTLRDAVLYSSFFGPYPKTPYDEPYDEKAPPLPFDAAFRPNAPLSLLGAADFDPFACVSMPLDRRMNAYFHHIVGALLPLRFPSPTQMEGVKQYTVPLALQDELLFISVIAWGAAHMNILLGQSAPTSSSALLRRSENVPDFMFYRAKSIAMLNQRMQSFTGAIGVTTLFAITRLILIELYAGNHEAFALHMKGLEQLILLRGGFEGLSFSLVQLILTLATPGLRARYNQATMSVFTGTNDQQLGESKELVLTSPSPINSFEGLAHECNILINTATPAHHRRIGEGFLSPEKSSLFDSGVMGIIHDVRMITICVEHTLGNPNGLTDAAMKFVGIRAADIQNQLSTPRQPHMGGEPAVQQACRLAMRIFMSESLDLPGLAASSYSLGLQMKESFESKQISIFGPAAQDAILWALFFGALVSVENVETYLWFIRQIQSTLVVLGIHDWDGVEDLLRNFFYLEEKHRDDFQQIWYMQQQICPATAVFDRSVGAVNDLFP